MTQVPTMLQALAEAQFPHPVAIRSSRDPELGAILEADAFDVPPDRVLAVHEDLGDVLWPCAFAPTTVLAGAFDTVESRRARADLPEGTVWYLPPARGPESR